MELKRSVEVDGDVVVVEDAVVARVALRLVAALDLDPPGFQDGSGVLLENLEVLQIAEVAGQLFLSQAGVE